MLVDGLLMTLVGSQEGCYGGFISGLHGVRVLSAQTADAAIRELRDGRTSKSCRRRHEHVDRGEG